MNVYRDLSRLPRFRNAVLTIGSFDGVHGGHQEIIRRINEIAKNVGGESIIISFHPHPRLVVYPDDDSLQLLTTTEEKIDLLREYNIDNVVIVPFTKAFSQQSPDDYIRHFLVEKFHPKKIVIGYDHRFGKKRAGDIEYLKRFTDDFGFEIEEIQKQTIQDIDVSSTKIRNALNLGHVAKAAALLQHPFVLTGKVVKGKQVGQTIGFPTANLDPENRHKLIPPEGIYAVRVCHEGKEYGGMLYIGNRPTLNGTTRSIEVNIFDFDKDIYGDSLKVSFIKYIRPDKKLNSLEELKTQLAADKVETLKIIGA